MRCRIVCLGALILLWGCVAAGSKKEPDPEPLTLFTLEVNGLSHAIEPDELVRLPPQKGELHLRLRVKPYRVFEVDGLKFRFPRSWFLQGGAGEWWCFSRKDFQLTVEIRRGQPDTKGAIEGWVGFYKLGQGEPTVVQGERPLRLGGQEIQGTTIFHQKIPPLGVTTIYALRSGGDTVLLTFWDADENRSPARSGEWREMEGWLKKTLTVVQ